MDSGECFKSCEGGNVDAKCFMQYFSRIKGVTVHSDIIFDKEVSTGEKGNKQ